MTAEKEVGEEPCNNALNEILTNHSFTISVPHWVFVPMTLMRHIDEYCERTDFSFWAEPTNAVTNFAIIIAGMVALHLYHRQFPLHGSQHRLSVLLLILLVWMIGFGSFLYHTFATEWAGYADFIPILIFIYVYHAVFLRRVLAMEYKHVLMYILGFFILSAFLILLGGQKALNGSIGYLPALLSFFTVWVAMKRLNRPGTRLFGGAAVLFLTSVMFRSIDNAICASFPLGTHFLWHLCNSCVLYMMLKLVIQLPDFYQRGQRDIKNTTRDSEAC